MHHSFFRFAVREGAEVVGGAKAWAGVVMVEEELELVYDWEELDADE